MSLDKRLTELFAIFEDKEKNVVDLSEMPHIIWALGLVPSEAEMAKTVQAMIGDESEQTIHVGAFLTVAKKIIMDRKFVPNHNLEIQTALEVVIKEGKKILSNEQSSNAVDALSSYDQTSSRTDCFNRNITKTEFLTLMTTKGEKLTQEEEDELHVALPMTNNYVSTDDYVHLLSPNVHFF